MTKPSNATTLAIVQGEDPNSRFIFAMKSEQAERPIVFRQESFSEDVGWFVQNEMEMTRSEMLSLRSALGGKMHRVCEFTASRIRQEEPAILPIRPFEPAAEKLA